MAVAFFLKRTKVLSGSPSSRDEYLYLTTEDYDLGGEARIIAPSLPGNDSSTLDGVDSTNFLLNLGSQQASIRISGFIVSILGSQAPTLTSPDIHILSGSQTQGDRTGAEIRDALLNYWADQSLQGGSVG